MYSRCKRKAKIDYRNKEDATPMKNEAKKKKKQPWRSIII